MIESIEFTNFKALRKTTLPLAPFTLLMGPNGSGKTTVLQALQGIATLAAQGARVERPSGARADLDWASLVNAGVKDQKEAVEVKLRMRLDQHLVDAVFRWAPNEQPTNQFIYEDGKGVQGADVMSLLQHLARMQTFALDASAIAQATAVSSAPLQPSGAALVAVLDDLRDNDTERWDLLLAEMCRWLPEYDDILFSKPEAGQKVISLRTKKGRHRIPAKDLSQGTLVALALLTLAYLPNPPSVVGLEEIDRALHPRLLRHLQDALYRLSYPERCRERRPPIQVIATSHSPYLLDLFREHPEEVVLADKRGLEVTMTRMSEIDHYEDIMGESPLSEVWYSGVLGGAAVQP